MHSRGSSGTPAFEGQKGGPPASGTYSVDGKSLRVKKIAGSTTTVYIFSGSKVLAEYQNGAPPNSPLLEFVYAGGTLIAKITSSGTYYYHQDHLSNRMITTSSGSVYAQMGHFPFGEAWYNASNIALYFTTYEFDPESGNHYAMARYHVSRLGRLSSPDPLSGSISNPQSLNRYSYSLNDPSILTDPSGATTTCNTAEADPNGQSQQTSGSSGEHSPDAGDTDLDAGAPQQQNGCISRVNPFGGGGDYFDGGYIGDDSGDLPSGTFQIGSGDEFGLLALAFTPTGFYIQPGSDPLQCVLDPDCDVPHFTPFNTGLIYGNLDLLDLPTPNVNVSQAKADAKQRVLQNAKCRDFVQKLLAKLYGTSGSSVNRITSRINSESVSVSSVPNSQNSNIAATTEPGTYNVTLYPSSYGAGADLPETLLHEAFHAGPAGKTDVQILNALVPSLHLPTNPTAAMEMASELWDSFLNANCGSH